MSYNNLIKKSKLGSGNIIWFFVFIWGFVVFNTTNAESLSNITETGEDFYLQKNINSANRIIIVTKMLWSGLVGWYQANNSQILDAKYFKLWVLDIVFLLFIISFLVYLHKSKKYLWRVK